MNKTMLMMTASQKSKIRNKKVNKPTLIAATNQTVMTLAHALASALTSGIVYAFAFSRIDFMLSDIYSPTPVEYFDAWR